MTTMATIDQWQVTAFEVLTIRALKRAGNWMLAKSHRSYRNKLSDVPLHRIHLHLVPDQQQLDAMLHGAWQEFAAVSEDVPGYDCLRDLAESYVRQLLVEQRPHARDELAQLLAEADCDSEAA